MATTASQILAAGTGGGTSSTFEVEHGPVCVRLLGASAALAGAETATLQYQDSGGNWQNLVDTVAGAGQMTAGDTVLKIDQRGTYRVVLTATAASTGLEIIDSYY